MKVIFQWVPQQRKFHFQLTHESNGTSSSLSTWVGPGEAIALFNVILTEIKKAATNPQILPDLIRMVDPRKVKQQEAEKILLANAAKNIDDGQLN